MSIITYDFTEFTDKDMFEMKLKGVIPNFGYIPCTKRKPFFDFCIEHRFLSKISNRKETISRHHENVHLCDVLVDFRFAGMLSYRPKPIIFITDYIIVVQPSFKMHNLRENENI